MIREATVDDIPSLAALYKELMVYHHKLNPEKFEIPNDNASEDKIKEKMDLGDLFIIICHETDGIIDGFAIFLTLAEKNSTEENPKGSVILHDLVVSENSRHKGIGTELINEVIKIAKENHCSSIILDVNTLNMDAQNFYEKKGFEPTTIQMRKRL